MKAETHRRGQRWIPACAESTPQYTPQKHPSHWTNMLGGIEKKYSGVLNKRTRAGNDGQRRQIYNLSAMS